MSGKGNCYDNAVTESFFHTLKTELTHHEKYQTKIQARQSLFEYIELFFNRKRIHSALGYKTPVEYKMLGKAALVLTICPFFCCNINAFVIPLTLCKHAYEKHLTYSLSLRAKGYAQKHFLPCSSTRAARTSPSSRASAATGSSS